MVESRVDRRLRYLRTGVNANFTISGQAREWKVDRGILCAESEYFEKMCLGGFSEASEGKVSFPGDEPDVIDQILVYLYAGVYDDLAVVSSTDDADQASSTLNMAKIKESALDNASTASITKVLNTGILVYRCAKMMDIPELETLAAHRFFEKEKYFIRSHFDRVLKTCFETLEADDPRMRLPIVDRCVVNKAALDRAQPKATLVLRTYEPALWEIGVRHYETAKYYEDLYKLAECTQKEVAVLLCEGAASVHKLELELRQAREKNEKLEMDVADLKFEWQALPMSCSNKNCHRSLVGSRWIKARNADARMQYICKCGKKYCSGRPFP